MKDINVRYLINKLFPVVLLSSACLICVYINPLSWLIGDPFFTEYCGLDVENQFGTTLLITPVYKSSFAVRLYRTSFPVAPAYQQRNIPVKSGDLISLSFDCSHLMSDLYVCDLEGECYVSQSVYHSFGEGGVTMMHQKYTIKSLGALSRPDTTLEAAIQSFPEHNYTGIINGLMCTIQIIIMIGGLYWLKKDKTSVNVTTKSTH